MAKLTGKKALFVLSEVGKWALVLWLLMPIRKAMSERVDFARVALGILLFILFAGKLFYDNILDSLLKRKENQTSRDIIAMFGMAAAIALVIGVVVLFIGLFVFSSIQNAGVEQE